MYRKVWIILLALLGYACKHPDQVSPATVSSAETLILLEDTELNVNAINGQTGQPQWSLPFRYDLTYSAGQSQLGQYTIADKQILYYAKPELAGIKNWSDTTALFARLPSVNRLGTINPLTGQVMRETVLKLSPGFILPCSNNFDFCTLSRYHSWLAVNDGVALLETVQSSDPPGHYDRKIVAMSTSSGAVLWTFDVESNFPTATVDKGKVYIGDTNKSYVIDLKNGSKLQEYAIGGIIPPFTSHRFFRPLNTGRVVVADAQTGGVTWSTEVGTTTKDLAIGDGLIITKVEDKNLIQARNATTGTVRWSYSDNTSGGFISLQVVNNTLYTMSRTRRVYALDLLTGSLLWKTGQYGAPDIQAKATMIYMMQTEHQLLGLDPSTGQQVWECFFMRDSPTRIIRDFAVFTHNELDF